MKWTLEFSDAPENNELQIKGFRTNSNGAKGQIQYFSVSDLLNILATPVFAQEAGSTSNIDNPFSNEQRIPTLPFGTVGYSSANVNGVQKERVSMVIDKGIYPIRYQSQENVHLIGLPKLLIQHLIMTIPGTSKKRIIESALFALKDDRKPITDQTTLYNFPFPNVEKNTGYVCMGSNDQMLFDELAHAYRAFNVFLDAPFNEDYGMSLSNGMYRFSDYLDSDLAAKEFDDELLLPNIKTFGQLYGDTFFNNIR